MPDQSGARGAQGKADGNLALACAGARQHQIGEIGTGDSRTSPESPRSNQSEVELSSRKLEKPFAAGHDPISDADVLYVVSHQRDLNFPPNTRYLYSNTGYMLLAQIVAHVGGQSFRTFTTERIFAPLGMKNSHFPDDFDQVVKNMAFGYLPSGDTYSMGLTNFDTVGATSLLTTVEDLALWDENFYNPRVGGPTLIQQLQERGRLNDGEQINYAAGLVLGKYRGLNTVDHNGADAGYVSDMIRFPDQHFTAACFCNLGSADPSDLARNVADIYLASDMGPAKPSDMGGSNSVTLTPAQMQANLGVYVNIKDPDDLVRWVIKDGKLNVGNVGEEQTYDVKPISESQFDVIDPPATITFLGTRSGTPLRFRITEDGKIDTYSEVPTFAPSASELAEYAGTYSSPEIDPLYELKVEDIHVAGTPSNQDRIGLVLSRLKNGPDPLQPVTKDFFTAGVGKIRFMRDSKGVISGFLLSTGRDLDLRFERGRPAIPTR